MELDPNWSNASAFAKLQTLFKHDPNHGRDADGGKLLPPFSPTSPQADPTHTAWDQAWKHDVTPWDTREVQPALRELVDERWSSVAAAGVEWHSLTGGKALVAGCGRVS